MERLALTDPRLGSALRSSSLRLRRAPRSSPRPQNKMQAENLVKMLQWKFGNLNLFECWKFGIKFLEFRILTAPNLKYEPRYLEKAAVKIDGKWRSLSSEIAWTAQDKVGSETFGWCSAHSSIVVESQRIILSIQSFKVNWTQFRKKRFSQKQLQFRIGKCNYSAFFSCGSPGHGGHAGVRVHGGRGLRGRGEGLRRAGRGCGEL